MPFFTGIFYIRDSIEVLQCSADDPVAALRSLIGRLPHDDAFDFSETDFATVTGTINGDHEPELSLVTGRRNVWYWLDGSRLDDRIDGYVVATAEP